MTFEAPVEKMPFENIVGTSIFFFFSHNDFYPMKDKFYI